MDNTLEQIKRYRALPTNEIDSDFFDVLNFIDDEDLKQKLRNKLKCFFEFNDSQTLKEVHEILDQCEMRLTC